MFRVTLGVQLSSWSEEKGGSMPPLRTLLRQVQAGGFKAFEVYYNDLQAWGLGVAELKEMLSDGWMTMSSARCFVSMSDPTYRTAELEELGRMARFLNNMGCEFLVLAAGEGRGGQALAYLAETLDEAGAICLAEGVKLAFHSKYGSTVQTADELARLVDSTQPQHVWLAPDTGQWFRGGINVGKAFSDYAARIGYVHASDVDPQGRPRPLGAGKVDFHTLRNVLDETNYAGWVIAEDRSEEVKMVGAAESARGSSLFLQRVLAAAADGRCVATLDF